MHRILKLLMCSAALFAIPCTYAETAEEVFREVDTRQRASISGPDNLSQTEMFEKMAAGGGVEVESIVTGMRCDAGVPDNEAYMQTIPGVSQGACIGFGSDGE